MSKRKTNPFAEEDENTLSASEASAPEPEPEPELIDGQWALGQWRGIQQLRCMLCQWDTLEGIEAAQAHKAQCARCAPPPPPPPTGVLVADSSGRVVEIK